MVHGRPRRPRPTRFGVRRRAVAALACLALGATAGCDGVAITPRARQALALDLWPMMSWGQRWCHARHYLASEPVRYGDGACESLL